MAGKASRYSSYWVDAEDLFQEGTLACWKWCQDNGLSWEALSKEDNSPHHGLLNTIFRRKIIDVCRGERKHVHCDIEDWDGACPDTSESDDMLNKIKEAMSYLSEKRRKVVTDILQGKSGSTTAGELGVSSTTVSRLGQKAIEEIKVWLQLLHQRESLVTLPQGRSSARARNLVTRHHQRVML